MLKTTCVNLVLRLGIPLRAAGCDSIRRLAADAAVAPGGGAQRDKMINKLLYRSRQRGFLELDLLVGLWAEQEVPKMDTAMLQQFAVVLDQENPDLLKWLTGQQEAPSQLQANAAFTALKQHVGQQLSDSCHTASQAAPGKEWLRGWDDSWRLSGKGKEGDDSAAHKAGSN